MYISDMKIEVSNGEIIDKLTILEIKLDMIADSSKLLNIKKEYDILLPIAVKLIDMNNSLVKQLKTINSELWEIEDQIRVQEKKNDFGHDFIELARQVYRKNDVRARLKKEINEFTGSDLTEEKSYKDY